MYPVDSASCAKLITDWISLCLPSIFPNDSPLKPKEKEDDLNVENLDLETGEDVIEDDTVLIEEETDIDPAVDVGIKPTEDKEEEF